MRRFITTIALAVAITLGAAAQQTLRYKGADEVVPMWDNTTAKHSNYETRDEVLHKGRSFRQTSSCELYIFKADPAKNRGVAIVMYPGGGYIKLNFHNSIARWYASQGFTAVIVKYRLPNGGHTDAVLEDAMGAIRYVRTRTDLGIDPKKVGVMGSSAGGHLASWMSNVMPDEEKPAFALLHYAWIDMLTSRSPAAERALPALLGKGYSKQDALDLSTHLMVSATTSPTLLLLCDDDPTVPSVDSAKYYEALVSHGVKCSMHIYPFGGHSVSKHKAEYQEAVVKWLKYLGISE